ncbi:methionine--tRNA ligase, partial [Dictyocaulus viviparus]
MCLNSSFRLVPVNGKRNILITAALPYVNNVPHLGNIIGCVLSADVFARYCRMCGYETLYVSGTDEYGTATETKALLEGLTPQEVCDKYHVIHKAIYEWFNIEFDIFGRTTTPQQTELAQDIFLKLYENGFTSSSSIDQLYCQKCEKFLADRFVNGVCPFCAYDDARGDQCDGCSRLVNAVECGNQRTFSCIWMLFRLNEVRDYVEKEISKADTRWSSNAIAIVKGWIKNGLEKRCITRDLKWGTAVPLDGFEDKVFYVWYDAPIGYLSITKCLVGDNWTKWWKNPENVELFNFIGKDNVAFHGVMFPCTQLGTREKYTIVNHVCATENLNYEDVKFSKSRNTGVFGDDAKNTGIEADVNSELLANFGNFVNRALSFLSKYFDGIMPEMQLEDSDLEFLIAIQGYSVEWAKLMESIHQRDAVRTVLAMSRKGNQYMQAQQPWVLIKGNDAERKRAGTIIGIAVNISFHLALVLHPIMPEVSARIRAQCGSDRLPAFFTYPISYLKPGHKIRTPKPLFLKMDSAKISEWREKFGGVASCRNSTLNVEGKTNLSQKVIGEKMMSKLGSMTQKLSDAAVTSVFDQLAMNQKQILELYEATLEKFNKARDLFVARKGAELEESVTKLQEEVETVRQQLVDAETAAGIKQFYTTVPAKATNYLDSKFSQENSSDTTSVNLSKQSTENHLQAIASVKKKTENLLADDSIDVGRLDLRVGRILSCERHPDADTLYVEQIDVGEPAPRTVVSGLVNHVPLEQMQNRLVVVLCNLKPAKMRGVESRGMVMCASCPEKVEILEVDQFAKPGTPITCPPYPHRPDVQLNPKKKIWESVAQELKMSKEGYAVWRNSPLLVD